MEYCSPPANVGVTTVPFADVIPQADGTCNVQYAEGNGYQAGVNFPTNPSQSFFDFYSDDGWIFAMGPDRFGDQPTGLGAGANAPANGVFTGYPVIASYDQVSAPAPNSFTATFPKAGTYPIEVDYTECCGGQLSLTLGTSYATPIPPQSITGPSLPNTYGPPNPSVMKQTTCSVGSPVNCDTGDFYHTFTDLFIPGRGVPLQLARTYNALTANQNGPFGYGWTDGYNTAATSWGTSVPPVTRSTGATATRMTPSHG